MRVVAVALVACACTAEGEPPGIGSKRLAVVGGGLENGYAAVGYLATQIGADWRGPFCGGTLIRDDLVITAAHCIVGGLDAGGTAFAIGLGAVGSSGVYPASRYIVNPQYDQTANLGGGSDLALLVLEQPVTGVEPARVADPAVGCTFRSVGYGRTITAPADSMDGYTNERKSFSLCVDSMDMGPTGVREPGVLLITGEDGGLCYGDSGGAMLIEGTNEIVATHSYILDETCPNLGRGGVTSIGERLDWIEGAVGRDPTVAIKTPADGAGVSAGFTIQIDAKDDLRLASVEILVDGVSIMTMASSGGTVTATAPADLSDGEHTVEARATDQGGKTATTSATVAVGAGGVDPGGDPNDPGGDPAGSGATVTGGCRVAVGGRLAASEGAIALLLVLAALALARSRRGA